MANASKLLLDLTAELLSRGTTVRFRPRGRSMYPSIREGELITVEPVAASDVKLADIVLYRSERGLIAHRVVGSSPTQSSVLSPQSSSLSFTRRCLPQLRPTRRGKPDFGPGDYGRPKSPQHHPGHEGSQTVAQGPPLGLRAQRVDLSSRDRFSPGSRLFGRNVNRR